MAPQEASYLSKGTLLERWMDHLAKRDQRSRRSFYSDNPHATINTSALFLISETASPINALEITPGSALDELTHVSNKFIHYTHVYGQCYLPAVSICIYARNFMCH
jgi:DNA helicase INO80